MPKPKRPDYDGWELDRSVPVGLATRNVPTIGTTRGSRLSGLRLRQVTKTRTPTVGENWTRFPNPQSVTLL